MEEQTPSQDQTPSEEQQKRKLNFFDEDDLKEQIKIAEKDIDKSFDAMKEGLNNMQADFKKIGTPDAVSPMASAMALANRAIPAEQRVKVISISCVILYFIILGIISCFKIAFNFPQPSSYLSVLVLASTFWFIFKPLFYTLWIFILKFKMKK